MKDYLRHNEYYNMQEVFDNLYIESRECHKFKNLVELITSNDNLLLAYRNIKSNKGNKTAGVNSYTIDDISALLINEYIRYMKERFDNFKPMKVRRVYIPKSNGKLRPLGIPNIEDRLI